MKLTGTKSDEVQAEYWNGYLTRSEAQKTFDHIGSVVKGLIQDVHGDVETKQEGLIAIIAKLDMTLAFVLHKLGVSTEEFQAFLNEKMAEFQAMQETAKKVAETPIESAPKVHLNKCGC